MFIEIPEIDDLIETTDKNQQSFYEEHYTQIGNRIISSIHMAVLKGCYSAVLVNTIHMYDKYFTMRILNNIKKQYEHAGYTFKVTSQNVDDTQTKIIVNIDWSYNAIKHRKEMERIRNEYRENLNKEVSEVRKSEPTSTVFTKLKNMLRPY